MDRKTANDYIKELREAREKLQGVENRIKQRAKELKTQHPEVNIGLYRYIDNTAIEVDIEIIDVIERHLAKKETFQQGELF